MRYTGLIRVTIRNSLAQLIDKIGKLVLLELRMPGGFTGMFSAHELTISAVRLYSRNASRESASVRRRVLGLCMAPAVLTPLQVLVASMTSKHLLTAEQPTALLLCSGVCTRTSKLKIRKQQVLDSGLSQAQSVPDFNLEMHEMLLFRGR